MFLLLVTHGLLASEVQFNRDILPVLSDKCFACHGPDKANQKADLRLDMRDVAIAAGAIVPGDPDGSEMIERILTEDEDDIMPPLKSHLSLSEDEKQNIIQWIKEGAVYEKHWAFIPIDPQGAKRSIRGEAHPVDEILFDSLEEMGLQAQPRAERTTLLRRVYFDLIGLPPTPAEVQAFLSDDTPDAYQQVVDDLLSRLEYGERMAVHWLDLARYADSNGYQTDRSRNVWAWKEWVISAFNRNLPYDKFATYQLAGDLLPDPTQEQRLATAFNRLHQYKTEGGSVEEEFRVEGVADRVNTFGTAFLGLTLECARCHDHKYDPISQKNYFEMFAFFDDIDESGLASHFGQPVPTPALPLMSEEFKARLDQHASGVARKEEALNQAIDQLNVSRVQSWVKQQTDLFATLSQGVSFNLEGKQDEDTGRGKLFNGDDMVKTDIGVVTRHDPFSISFWIRAEAHQERTMICHLSDWYLDAASRGWELTSLDGKLRFSLIHFWPGNAISIETKEVLPEQKWVHVALSYDGSSRAEGMRLFVNGKSAETQVIRDSLTKFITKMDFPKKNKDISGVRWGARYRDHGFKGGRVDAAFFYDRVLHPMEVSRIFSPEEKQEISEDFSTYVYTQSPASGIPELSAALSQARREYGKVLDGVPEILTMSELPQPKRAFILNRGVYDDRGTEVFSATPESLPAMDDRLPRNRLGLAKWLIGSDHPLFARVAVNRFWMLCFGRGLVDTPEDFGLQGEQPQYPELLNYLANDFRESGWDVKALMRKIVTSQAYQQRSFSTHQQMQSDPTNKLIARGPSYRLPAEMIRDSALLASGLLVTAKSGVPQRPYDMSEAFKKMSVSKGDGVYHRSIYSLWKRSAPSPVMMAFDGVKREVCSAKRQTTNTPLQSLVLLNGPQFVEAARVAGTAAWEHSDGNVDQMVEDLSLRFISRRPSAAEMEILTGLYREQEEYFTTEPAEAEALLKIGHTAAPSGTSISGIAAATVLAQTLMNFDESIVKR